MINSGKNSQSDLKVSDRSKENSSKKVSGDNKENKKEQKSKYARKTSDEDVQAARTRYLTRKLAMERAKLGVGSND